MKNINKFLASIILAFPVVGCGSPNDVYGPNPYSIDCQNDKDCQENETIKQLAGDKISDWFCQNNTCISHEDAASDAASDR